MEEGEPATKDILGERFPSFPTARSFLSFHPYLRDCGDHSDPALPVRRLWALCTSNAGSYLGFTVAARRALFFAVGDSTIIDTRTDHTCV